MDGHGHEIYIVTISEIICPAVMETWHCFTCTATSCHASTDSFFLSDAFTKPGDYATGISNWLLHGVNRQPSSCSKHCNWYLKINLL